METTTKKGMSGWEVGLAVAMLVLTLGALEYTSYKKDIRYRNARDRLITLADTNRNNILDLEEKADLWKKMGNSLPYSGQSIKEIFDYHDDLEQIEKQQRINRILSQYTRD